MKGSRCADQTNNLVAVWHKPVKSLDHWVSVSPPSFHLHLLCALAFVTFTASSNQQPAKASLQENVKPTLHGHVCFHLLNLLFSRRRETLLVPPLPASLRRPIQPASSPPNPLWSEEVPVCVLLKDLLQDLTPSQASRGRLPTVLTAWHSDSNHTGLLLQSLELHQKDSWSVRAALPKLETSYRNICILQEWRWTFYSLPCDFLLLWLWINKYFKNNWHQTSA